LGLLVLVVQQARYQWWACSIYSVIPIQV